MDEQGPSRGPADSVASRDVSVVTRVGARWRKGDSTWDLVDPPGTHRDKIRQETVLMPLLDLAARLEREPMADDDAVARLRARAGTDATALLDAAAMVAGSGNPRVQRFHALVMKAATQED